MKTNKLKHINPASPDSYSTPNKCSEFFQKTELNLMKNKKTELNSDILLRRASAAPSRSLSQVLVPIGKLISSKDKETNSLSSLERLFETKHKKAEERYEITEELTRGGMGRILRGKDQKLRRSVVLKELLQQNTNVSKERFLREALITARLEHPSIVPIHDMGNWESGTPYYAMKHIDGRSLHEVLCKKKNLQERLTLLPHLIDACEAVAYAHENQIIHRDLKPQNILVGSFGETVVIDWGIAKDLQETQPLPEVSAGPYRVPGKESELTEEGDILGTPAYMPLEQALGEEVDKRADVYALGAILYHLLSGEAPYQGKENREILEVLKKKAPLPVEQKVASVPKDLLSIVNKAMAREPENRYSSANSLAEELKKFQAGQLVSSHSYSQKELLFRFSKRHLGMLILASLAVTILLVGGYFYYQDLQYAYLQETSARVLAEEQGQKADRSFALLLKEQGRQELLAGNIAQAAVLLSESYQRITTRGEEDKNLQLLLGNAMKRFNNWYLLTGPQEVVINAVFSEDGKTVITSHKNGTVSSWDSESRELLSKIECARSEEQIIHTVWKGDRLIALNENGVLKVWDSKTCDLFLLFPEDSKTKQVYYFTLDMEELTVWYSDDTDLEYLEGRIVEVWDINTGEMLSSGRESINWYGPSISPDKQKRARIDQNGNVQIFNKNDGMLLTSIRSEEKGVRFIVAGFSSDGTHLFLRKTNETHEHDTLEIRDAVSYKLLQTRSHNNKKERIKVFSKNYDKFITLGKFHSNNQEVKIWDISTAKWITSLKVSPHNPWISDFKFFPDGNRVLTILKQTLSDKDEISIWDVNTGEFLLSLEEPPPLSPQISSKQVFRTNNFYNLSSNGKQLLRLGIDGRVILWDLESNSSTLAFESVSKQTPIKRFSPDRSKLLMTTLEKNAVVWDTNTAEKLFTLEGHNHLIVSVVFSQDNQKILTASIDQTIKLWDANTGEILNSFEEDTPILQAAFSKDGTKVLTLGMKNRFQLRETNTGKILQSFRTDLPSLLPQIKLCSPSENTQVLQESMLPCLPGTTTSAKTESNHLLSSLLDKFEYNYLQRIALVQWYLFFKDEDKTLGQFSPDEKYLAIPNGKEIQIWDLNLMQMKIVLTYKNQLHSIQFSPDGSKLLIETSDENKNSFFTQVYSVETGKELANESFNANPFASFSKDSQELITNTGQLTRIWDANSGQLLRSVKSTETIPDKIIYSPNKEQFLSFGSVEAEINLWDNKSGKKLLKFEVSSKVIDARFSPDGNKVLLTYEKEPMQLWDLLIETRTPKEVSKIVKEKIPWELDEENGYLVPRPLNSASL